MMIRKTLTILSLIGLLLSVWLWGVSYWYTGYYGPNGKYLAATEYGSLRFIYAWQVDDNEREGIWFIQGYKNLATRWTPAIATYPTHVRIILPFWIPTLVFALTLSATRPMHNRRRRKRNKLGLCLKCGYDLRASKDRCPECGTGFSK